MRSYITRTLGFTAATLLLAASAQAQGKRNGNHHVDKHRTAEVRHSDNHVYRNSNRDIYRHDRSYDRDVYRRYDRDVYGRDIYRSRGVPPGLAKKPGHMPPGQYKKHYGTYEGANVLGEIMRRRGYRVLRIVPAGTSRYVYYRPNNGREQCAIVRDGTDRLRFSNVPSGVLQAVLAQLY